MVKMWSGFIFLCVIIFFFLFFGWSSHQVRRFGFSEFLWPQWRIARSWWFVCRRRHVVVGHFFCVCTQHISTIPWRCCCRLGFHAIIKAMRRWRSMCGSSYIVRGFVPFFGLPWDCANCGMRLKGLAGWRDALKPEKKKRWLVLYGHLMGTHIARTLGTGIVVFGFNCFNNICSILYWKDS